MVKKLSVETLVLSVDFDGCSDTKYARNALIERIVAFVRGTSYQNIIICIGSLRQSVWIDSLNAMQNKPDEMYQSCCVLGLDFIEALRPYLDERITLSFENILTYDVYHQLQFGTTFSFFQQADYRAYHTSKRPVSWMVDNTEKMPVEMLKWTGTNYDLSEKKTQELSANDTTKKDIMYMQMHHFAQFLGDNTHFSFVLIDDKQPILKKLDQFFSDYAGLIPRTCFFKGMQHAPYERWLEPIETTWIRGCGVINSAFDVHLREMRMLALKTPHEYEVIYAAALSELARKSVARVMVDAVNSQDRNISPPSTSRKRHSSKPVGMTGFVMQVVCHSPISCFGVLACLSVLVLGTGKKRTAAGVGVVLFASPWITNGIFASNKKADDDEPPVSTKGLL
ncbi:MAG: hypothetical protein K0U37_00565 [Gammaproteobacteria bacterium]|nr:hypothetical protein [Gammaproteobacteria bacterium]